MDVCLIWPEWWSWIGVLSQVKIWAAVGLFSNIFLANNVFSNWWCLLCFVALVIGNHFLHLAGKVYHTKLLPPANMDCILSEVFWGPPFENGLKKRKPEFSCRSSLCALQFLGFKAFTWSLCQSTWNQGRRLNHYFTNPNNFEHCSFAATSYHQ